MDWSQIQDTLEARFAAMAEVPAGWRDGREDGGFWGDTHLLLDVIQSSRVGVDEVRATYDEDAQTITETHVGRRQITVTALVRSLDQRLAGQARATLERVRRRLRFRAQAEAFASVDLALIEDLPVLDLPTEIDGRAISVAAMDLRFAALSQEADAAIETIECVELSTDMLGADGASLPDSLQLDEVLIEAS